MHHHIFPSQDTYITNQSGFEGKNFGINEILRIGTSNVLVQTIQTTTPFYYLDDYVSGSCLTSFSGSLTGSFVGYSPIAYGLIQGNAAFTSSYFSGSVNGGSIVEISGSVSGIILGNVTGSLLSNYLPNFSGSLSGSSGQVTGILNGVDYQNIAVPLTVTKKFVDRTMIQFDVTAISESIANGDISSLVFTLNLKVCNEYDLPISYAVYAFPISQSWNMGNGYWSDGGSDTGASWYYLDFNYRTYWYPTTSGSVPPIIDFLNTGSNAVASFAYGGATWYTSSMAVQQFNYESSDISMDVTPIVMDWINGSIPNNGFILISSDEIESSGSGFALTFYSQDTNSVNSPYLDAAWSDWVWITGSLTTASINIATATGAISASVQSGSTFSLGGGISGSFTGSMFIVLSSNYVTASDASVAGVELFQFTSSNFSGSFIASIPPSASNYFTSSMATFYADFFQGDVNGTATSSISSSYFEIEASGSAVGTFSSSMFTGSLMSPDVVVTGIVSGYWLDTQLNQFTGFLSCIGTSGSIAGDPVFGRVAGLVSITASFVQPPSEMLTLYPIEPNEWPYTTGYAFINGDSPYNEFVNLWYNYDSEGWYSYLPILPSYPVTVACGPTYTAQMMVGTFLDGMFSGSEFIAYYSNFQILFGTLSGSLSLNAIYGVPMTIPLPSGIDPFAYAYFYGTYLNGTALGQYFVSSSVSASFYGQMITGDLIGGYVNVQLGGSVVTASYAYTSSVDFTSSLFQPLDTSNPFTVIVKNLNPEYKGGDIPRITVFGRPQSPMKKFETTSVQSAYITPKLLPTSSFYAIKDNWSEEMIVDFDNYTQISCDTNGHFFQLDTTGLAQERPYRILIRLESSGSKYTFDNGDIFKITR